MTNTTPAERHPAVAGVLRFFEFEHLPPGPIKDEARTFAYFAEAIADRYAVLNDPELTWALRQLLAAKDAAVRCAVLEVRAATGQRVIVNPSEFIPSAADPAVTTTRLAP